MLFNALHMDFSEESLVQKVSLLATSLGFLFSSDSLRFIIADLELFPPDPDLTY
jgi:hypothetical protein